MAKATNVVIETVHLDQELSEAIDSMAEAFGIRRDKLIRRILREHLESFGAVDWPPELDEDTPVSGEA